MGKSSKTKTQGAASRQSHERGFDFGQPLTSFVEVGLGHLDYFARADVGGCAYGSVWSEELGAGIPVVTILARYREPLRAAMSELRSWGDGVDGDAVDMTAVFLKNGAWLLGLSPEPRRLAARTQGADLLLDPLYLAPTWIKTLDTTDPFLARFRAYQDAMFAPFILNAAAWSGARPDERRPNETQLNTLEPELSLLKFQCTFADEETVEPGSQAHLMLSTFRRDGQKGRGRSSGDGRGQTRPEIGRVKAKREHVLSSLFTVSRRRGDRAGLTAAALDRLAPLGVQRWQVEQAIANVVLSRRICEADHYATVDTRSFKNAVIEGAYSHTEFADGDLSRFSITPDILDRQIDLDGRDLLKVFGYSPKKDGLAATLGELRRRHLIHA